MNSFRRLSCVPRRYLSMQTQIKENLSVSPDIENKKLEIEEHHRSLLANQDLFAVHDLFTVKDLYDARVHYGHKLGSLNDQMKPYLYGHRLGHTIFDLDLTAQYLRTALNFTAHVAYKNGIILFFLRHPQNAHLVEKAAQECNEFAHTRFWRGGVFTNANVQFGAVTRLPDLCIFFSTLNTILTQHIAVRDCAKMLIPTVGIVDSNSNPNLITYPVPGNDDSPTSIELYCNLFKKAIMRGKERRKIDLSLNKL